MLPDGSRTAVGNGRDCSDLMKCETDICLCTVDPADMPCSASLSILHTYTTSRSNKHDAYKPARFLSIHNPIHKAQQKSLLTGHALPVCVILKCIIFPAAIVSGALTISDGIYLRCIFYFCEFRTANGLGTSRHVDLCARQAGPEFTLRAVLHSLA